MLYLQLSESQHHFPNNHWVTNYLVFVNPSHSSLPQIPLVLQGTQKPYHYQVLHHPDFTSTVTQYISNNGDHIRVRHN